MKQSVVGKPKTKIKNVVFSIILTGFVGFFGIFGKTLNANEKLLLDTTPKVEIVADVNPKEYDCVKSILWFESRNQGYNGMKAVLSVVVNRYRHKNYPESFCKIESQPKQFSYVVNGRKPKIKVTNEQDEKALAQASKLAYDAVIGSFKPIFPGTVLHYARKEIENQWTKKLDRYVQVGDHVFYKSKGGS